MTKYPIIHFLRSAMVAHWLIAFLAVACVIGGCLPSASSFQTSLPFIVLLATLLLHLSLVLFHRLRRHDIKRDWTFLATHLGIWLALLSGMAGAGCDKTLRAIISQKGMTTEAIDADGYVNRLPYSLQLQDFHIETNATDGSPMQYSATVLVDGKPAVIAVNSPYSVSIAEDIYLMDYSDEANGTVCLMTIERQPLKYAMLAGICLLLVGSVFYGIRKLKRRSFIIVAAGFIFIYLLQPGIHDPGLAPVLRSAWFTPHVAAYMFSYCIFGCAFLLAVAGLLRRNGDYLRSTDLLVGIGMAFLTFGMLSGCIWAKQAWGSYWTWDPKETWAAATWCAYLMYIHRRLSTTGSHVISYIWLIFGFLIIQMCWYGINFLPSAVGSLHRYSV